MLRRFRLGSGLKVVSAAPAVIVGSGSAATGAAEGQAADATAPADASGEDEDAFEFRDPVSVVVRSGVHDK